MCNTRLDLPAFQVAVVDWKTTVVVVAVKWQQLAYHSQCLPFLIVCN